MVKVTKVTTEKIGDRWVTSQCILLPDKNGLPCFNLNLAVAGTELGAKILFKIGIKK